MYMASLAKVIKDEIQKSARKEAAALLRKRGTKDTELRQSVAGLKKRIAALERENKALSKRLNSTESTSTTSTRGTARPPQKDGRRRYSGKGIAGIRARLKLTAGQFAKLTGVSMATVYNWENSTGPIRLRGTTRDALDEAVTMGRKEALARLTEMGVPTVVKRGRRPKNADAPPPPKRPRGRPRKNA